MKIEIMFFGQLTDITGSNTVTVDGVNNTDELMLTLCARFPELAQARFRIAVDNRIINSNTTITANSKIAFMPPFSGG